MKQLVLLTAILLLVMTTATAHALGNQLKDNPSPYLALHADDPVAWQEWNEQTLALARRQNKLIFLSIGYFSCQGCHKLHREALLDPEIARYLNEHYIPVMVDREILTALDDELQTYALQTTGLVGWPLNVFITPEGHPVAIALYETRQKLLQTLSYARKRWDTERDRILKDARAAADVRLAYQPKAVRVTAAVAKKYREKFLGEIFARADLYRGGFGSGSKYPMASQLDTLLELYRQRPGQKLGKFLQIWLDAMADLGLHDHVGGGFFRYTTDSEWQQPHYEKMLYDNAQLASLYLKAAEIFQRPRYRQVAFDTLDFLAAQMRDNKTGGFMASTSAVDEQHRPGAYYQWSKEELKRLLAPQEYAVVARVWDMDRRAALAYGYLPVNRTQPNDAERQTLREVYRKLAQAREKRALNIDDKQVASLNGLAMRAYSEAALLDARYAPLAKGVRDFVLDKLWREGGLAKAFNGGQIIAHGEFDDYTYLSAGFIAYSRLSGDAQDRRIADELATAAWQMFHSTKGWKAQKKSLLAGNPYHQLIEDGVTPSPSAVLIGISLQSEDAALAARGAKALQMGHEVLDNGTFWHAAQVGLLQSVNATSFARSK